MTDDDVLRTELPGDDELKGTKKKPAPAPAKNPPGTLAVVTRTAGRSRCKSCKKPITWYELTTGKKHCFDGHDVQTSDAGHDAQGRAIGLVHLVRYSSHFQTCPQAAQWRKPKPKQAPLL